MKSVITTPIQTRMSDYDVLGHINNVSYVNFLEVARLAAFGEVMKLDLSRYSGVTAKTEIEYLRPAKFGAQVAVNMGVSDVGAKRINLSLEVVDAKDHSRVFASAKIVQVTIDLKTGRPCEHPTDLRVQLEALMNGEAELDNVA